MAQHDMRKYIYIPAARKIVKETIAAALAHEQSLYPLPAYVERLIKQIGRDISKGLGQ